MWPTVLRAWTWVAQHTTGDRLITFLVAVATLVTAFAAYRQVVISQRQLTLSQRAWLTVKSASFENWDAVGAQAHFVIVLQNSGPSPANQVATVIDSLKWPDSRPPEHLFHRDTSNLQQGVTIGPSGDIVHTWEFTVDHLPYKLTADDVTKIKNNQLYLFVFGETVYRDIFNEPHHTRWCWYAPDPHDVTPAPRMCGVWNTAD